MKLSEELRRRGVPELRLSDDTLDHNAVWENYRQELINILASEEYGYAPPAPEKVWYSITAHNKFDYAGKAETTSLTLKFDTDGGQFFFPVELFIPNERENPPVVVYLSHESNYPNRYLPIEEIIDRGVAVAAFCYQHITNDTDDGFYSGLAAMYDRRKYSWGKIAMWAWAASRVMDYLSTQKCFNLQKAAVMGHSRLGKAALWCGANDTRFSYVIANDAGCSGDAITREKTGEHVKDITTKFPYWFCQNYKKYAGNEENMPFDQHYLLAAIAPRRLYLGTSILDSWADPFSEYLAAYAASSAYHYLGLDGLPADAADEPPVGNIFDEGYIAFHMRAGRHFLSREDWKLYLDYIEKT